MSYDILQAMTDMATAYRERPAATGPVELLVTDLQHAMLVAHVEESGLHATPANIDAAASAMLPFAATIKRYET